MIFKVYDSCDNLMATIDAESVEMGNNNGICIDGGAILNFENDVARIVPETEEYSDSVSIDIGDKLYDAIVEALRDRGANDDVAEEIASSISCACVDVDFTVNYENRDVHIISITRYW